LLYTGIYLFLVLIRPSIVGESYSELKLQKIEVRQNILALAASGSDHLLTWSHVQICEHVLVTFSGAGERAG